MSEFISITHTILRSPWAAAVIGLGLWIHGASQPGPLRRGCFRPHMLPVSRTAAGLVRVHEWERSGEDAVRARVWIDHRVRRIGFWCPTSESIATTLRIDDAEFEASLTAAERSELRWQIADRLQEFGFGGPYLAALRAGEGATATAIPMGYVKNAFVMLAAGAFFYSLCFVPSHTAAFAARARVTRAALTGRCPKCDYDLVGLPGPRCPECGHDPTDYDEHYF